MLIQDAGDKNTKHESHNFSRRQCNLCWKILHDSYYETNGMSLCKDCYCSAGSREECYKCKAVILNSEMVMKCDGIFFHWRCFQCSVCHAKLEEGRKYGIIAGTLFCEQHFVDATFQLKKEKARGDSERTENDFLAYFCYSLEQTLFRSSLFQTQDTPDFQIDALSDSPRGYLSLETPQFACNASSDVLHINSPFNHSSIMAPEQMKAKSNNICKNKRKRHRTTFRQDQLKEMKSVFDLNPNPDTAELQRLSQRLGLSKRVLQVWFQNARAKQRRCPSINKQEFV
eukprot:gene10194-18868_t